jgi:probable HAF family extracellular repeat protein
MLKGENTLKNVRSLLLTILGTLSVVSSAAAQGLSPVYLNLPAPTGTGSYAFGVNQSGQVVGGICPSGAAFCAPKPNQAFVWQNGVTTLVGGPGAVQLYAINNLGNAAGSSGIYAAVWVNGMVSNLPRAGCCGGETDWATALNDVGQVVGGSGIFPPCNGCSPEFAPESILWQNGGATVIHPSGSFFSYGATGINNAGQVIIDGKFAPPSGLLWQNGVTTVLGINAPSGINDSGQIVGTTTSGHLALWQNGQIQDLGLPPGCTGFTPSAIDSTGRIVGNCGSPWVWKNGVFTILNGNGASVSGIASTGSGAIAAGTCNGNAPPVAACIWNVP